jgi:hypothetical protein
MSNYFPRGRPLEKTGGLVNERLVEVRSGSIVSESHVWRGSVWLLRTIGHSLPLPLKSTLVPEPRPPGSV